MLKYVLTLILLFTPITTLAQDIPDDPKAPAGKLDEKNLDKDRKIEPPKQEVLELKEIVKAQSALSKRVFFIIDVSGSMSSSDKIKNALKFVRTVWQSPVDEFEIAVIVFHDKSIRWEGFPSPKDDPKPAPKGWAKLPSKDATDAAQAFLNNYSGSGGTNPISAFETVLKEDRSDLSIVFITDGDYDGGPKETLDTIKKLQEEREKKGLGKAVISVFGVGGAEKEANLSEIGKDYLGGFYIEKPKKVVEATPSSDPPKAMIKDDSDTPDKDSDIFQGFPHRSSKPWEKFRHHKKLSTINPR